MLNTGFVVFNIFNIIIIIYYQLLLDLKIFILFLKLTLKIQIVTLQLKRKSK